MSATKVILDPEEFVDATSEFGGDSDWLYRQHDLRCWYAIQEECRENRDREGLAEATAIVEELERRNGIC